MLEGTSGGLVQCPDPSKPKLIALVLNHFCNSASPLLWFFANDKMDQ